MKFFVDTANLEQIRTARSWGFISGVTVNPVLMAKESLDYKSHALALLEIADKGWDVSLEVRSGGAEAMIAQAKVLASWDKRVRVKLPTTMEGLQAASQLLKEIPLNMTIVKSPAQGLISMALLNHLPDGDMVLSVFCGRLRQAGHDWKQVIESLAQRRSRAKILAASIKTPADLSEAVAAGSDIVTAPLDVYQMVLSSPLVEEDRAAFDAAFDEKGLKVPS
ncbi:MAG: fructose-6-phosphate aldolase [Deltaproteobacteria bacterium]|nr:fructose-6-phosphate aldolase [Deltaproteobacteria bacterium]MBI4223345.1 fructose-6-phosphate aldolase [Deltaproteobacteria bacterium]